MIILLAAEEKLSPALHQTFAKCINKGLINPPKFLNLIYYVPVLYENIKKIHPAEHQGPMPYPLKSFADIENLVRLSF